MKILHIFKKFATKFILIFILIVMMLISLARFNNFYNESINATSELNDLKNIQVQISSFPMVKNDKLSFSGVIIRGESIISDRLTFDISLKNSSLRTLNPGDIILLDEAVLFTPENAGIEGGFDSATYFKGRNTYGTIYSESKPLVIKKCNNNFICTMNHMRNRVLNSIDDFFGKGYRGLVKALITGERFDIADLTEENLKTSGVYHIVAISGLHLNIFIMFVSAFISRLKLKRLKKALLSGILCTVTAVFVLIFTGFGLSVVRAFVMLVISLGSSIFSRHYNSKNSLMISTALIVIINPAGFYNIGFRLSVLSTFAVIFSADLYSKLKENPKTPSILKGKFSAVFTTSTACALFTLPVTMSSFYFLPTYSALSNFLILPAVTPLLILGVIFCTFALLNLKFIATIISYVMYSLLFYIKKASEIISSIPFARINLYPEYTFMILLFASLIFLCIYFTIRKMNKLRFTALGIFVLALCTVLMYNSIDKDAKLIFADVGQGECSIIQIPNTAAIMIDCGSSDKTEYIGNDIKNMLIKNNINKLSAVFVSHFHTDHVSEVINLTESGLVESVFIPDLYNRNNEENAENHDKIISAALKNDTKIYRIKEGSAVNFGNDCLFEILSPDYDMFMSDNNMSAVIKFTYGNLKILFTGDIENEALEKLCVKDIDCDILKLPHHGGKSKMLQEFLERTTPEYGLIGCGKNNIYKHPHQSTTDTLQNEKIKYFRTDESDSVSMTFDKNKIKTISKMR